MNKDKRLRGVSFNSNESGNSQPTVHRKQLIINVLEAKGLTTGNPKKEKLTPYCLISFNNVHFRTNVLNPTVRPEWKQRFTYNEKDLQSDTAELLISVWDSDKYSTDTFLGQISMPIVNMKANEVCKQWCTLTTKEGQETKGKLLIEFNLITSDGVLQKRFSSKTKFNAVNGDKPQIEIISITPEMQAKEAELSPRSSRTEIDKPNSALRNSVNMRDLDSSESPRAVTRTDSNLSGPGSGSKRRGSTTGAETSPERNNNNTNKTTKTEDLNTSRENNGPESADVVSSNNHTNKTDKSVSVDHLQESSSQESNKKELINLQGDTYKQPETPAGETGDKPNETPTKRKSSSKLGFLKISMKKKANSTPATPESKKKHSSKWKKFSRKLTPSKKGNKTDDESDWSKDFSDIAERTPFVTKYPVIASQLQKVELDRQEAISALLLSMQRLNQDLHCVLQEYYSPMKKNSLITKDFKQVFADVEELASGVGRIAEVLEERQSSSPVIEKAADAFNKRDSLWTKYASYLTNYDKMMKRVDNARAESDKVNQFLTAKGRELAPLETLLARPVQHLLDLELLLDDLDNATASSHPDSKYVGEMVKIVHNCLENMNSDRLMHFSKLRELQRQLYFTQKVKKFSLWANAERTLMFEGSGSVHPLRKPGTRNEIFLLVFNDMLLITRPKRVSTKKLTLNNKVSRHLLVTRRVPLNEMFLHDPSLDIREQIPDVIEIVSPNVGVWRLGMGSEAERVTKIIESQLARVGPAMSDSDKSTEYNRLVELAKSRQPTRSKSRASASQLSPRSPRSPRKTPLLDLERVGSNTNTAATEQMMSELDKARDAVRELAMKASIAEQERDEYRRRMEEEIQERIKLERVISTQQEQITQLKLSQNSKPAKETIETQTLLDMLKHETEARREIEDHNRELRNNYLKLTALVTEKQLQESQLMGRVLSLEHELARKDESSHVHRDVIRERQNIEELLERGKKDLMKRLAESKQAIQREFNQLIEVATGYANARGNMSDDDMDVSPRVMSFTVPQNGYTSNKSPGVSPRQIETKTNGVVASGSNVSIGYTSSDTGEPSNKPREVGRLNLNNSTRTLNPSGAKSPVATPTGTKSPKSKKVKTYNYSSDNAEENKESWKAKLRLSTKKKKEVQATPWRTPPPTTTQNQPFALQFKSNKVDWNTVKNEQSYWSDDFNESDYSSGVITGARAAPNGGENYDDLDNSVSVDDQQ